MKKGVLAYLTLLFFFMAAYAFAEESNYAYVKSVSAAESLESSSNISYNPSNVLDEDPATVWSATFGEMKTELTFDLEAPTILSSFYIENGYWKNSMTLGYNSRAKDVDIYFDGEKVQSVVLDDVTSLAEDYVMGKYGQTVQFPQTEKYITQVKFVFTSVYKGSKWNDLAISCIRLNQAEGSVVQEVVDEEEIFHDNGGSDDFASSDETVVGEAENDGDSDEDSQEAESDYSYATDESCQCEEWTLCSCELNFFWRYCPLFLLALILIPAIVGFFVPALSGYKIIGIVISVVLIVLMILCGGPEGLVLKVANIFLTIAKIVTYIVCFSIAAFFVYLFKGGSIKSSGSGSVSITGYSISGSTLYVKVEDSNGNTNTISKTVSGKIYDVVYCGSKSIDIRIHGGGSKGFKLKGSSAGNCWLS